MHILRDIALDAFESRKAELRGKMVKRGANLIPLKLHVSPKLGKVLTSEINQPDIRDTPSPIWHTKAETT